MSAVADIVVPTDAYGDFGLAGLPDGPYPIAAALIELDEHAHLQHATIDFLFRHKPKVKHTRTILGTAYMPSVNGDLSPLFDWMLARLLGREPTFLITLDFSYWRDATARQREILVYHELLHCAQAVDAYGAPKFSRTTGWPVYAIAPHDVEEFDAVIRKYGAHDIGLQQFVLAATEHYEETSK